MSDDERETDADAARTDDSERADRPKSCAHCGKRIDTTEWHPVATVDDDGAFRVYAFCDEDCRDEWIDDEQG
jgi:hypothetical protein